MLGQIQTGIELEEQATQALAQEILNDPYLWDIYGEFSVYDGDGASFRHFVHEEMFTWVMHLDLINVDWDVLLDILENQES